MPILHRAPVYRYVVDEKLATTRVMPVFRVFALCIAVLCGFVIGQLFGSVALPMRVFPRTTMDLVNDAFTVTFFNKNLSAVRITQPPPQPAINGHYLLKLTYMDNALVPVALPSLQYSSNATAVEFEILSAGGFFIESSFVIAISVVFGAVTYLISMGTFGYWRDSIAYSIDGARLYSE